LQRNLEKNQLSDLRLFYEKEGSIIKRYDSSNFWEKRYHQRKANFVLKALKMLAIKGSFVLDVGCGTGELSLSAQKLGGWVVSLDISKSYLRRVDKKVENRICASSDNLPFRMSSLNIVLCTDVIEHLPSYELAISELYRVSSNVLLITAPCNGVSRRLFGILFPEKLSRLDKKVGHIQIWSLKDLGQKLSKTNWSTSCSSIHVVQPILNNSFPRQLGFLARLLEKTADFLLPNEGTISLFIARYNNNTVNKR
jgi:ubiquinone/menaquinone biosynthesis C-methylase UbiE